LTKRYLRGRGRYGATPHPKVATLDLILQEREKPFAVKENDPLEWVRAKLRDHKQEFVKNADQIYAEKRAKRPIKPVYS
jgi:pyruvate/oxaloacetate carboxyltransferase